VILTRGKLLEAPLTELRKMHLEEPVVNGLPQEPKRIAGTVSSPQHDRNSVADEYAQRQREEIVRALTTCRGRVGGANGAAARLGINRGTLLSRMKKFGIYAKQFA
jgi:formate hydrogenlyase transcriptional activator